MRRVLGKVIAVSSAITAGHFVYTKRTTRIEVKEDFSRHLSEQNKKHWLRDMSEPYVNPAMLPFLKKHEQFSHLVPDEKSKEKAAMETPIELVDMSKCPVKLPQSPAILGAGGFTGLVSTAYLLEEANAAGVPIVVISNQKGPRVGDWWAGVIELDTDAEQYTGMHPSTFLSRQLMRVFSPEQMSEIQKTGRPRDWRSLDAVGFLMAGPIICGKAAWLAFKFELKQRNTDRAAAAAKLSKELQLSKKMFEELNARTGDKLLIGKDSLMVARTEEEARDLQGLKEYLAKESVQLQPITHEQVKDRYMDFNGVSFAIKPDFVMAANHPQILTGYLQKNGAIVHDAIIKRIFVEQNSKHRIAEYQTHDGKIHYVAFQQMFGSFGNQKVKGLDGKPLFNLVRGQGFSALARIRYPVNVTMPACIFPGGISRRLVPLAPAQVINENGKQMNEQLWRITADACVMAPNQPESAQFFDPNHAMGVVKAVESTLGPKAQVDLILGTGCPRPVGEEGETYIQSPVPGMYITGGQGGGGGTRTFHALLQPDVKATVPFKYS